MGSISYAAIISRLLTTIVFGYVGFKLSKQFSPPKNVIAWIILILVVLLSSYIGVNAKLVAVDEFGLYLNSLLLGSGFGLILGFINKLIKMQSRASKTIL